MNKNVSAYKQLNRFAGNWKMEGILFRDDEAPVTVTGTDSYEWLPGGFFLLHKADVMVGDNRSETFEIIGYDEVTGHYTMQYYESSGISGQMIAMYHSGSWIFTGDNLQFTGSFAEDGNSISGRWERLNGNTWLKFMDITLRKL